MINWDEYPNFSEKEFVCSHCGESNMKKATIEKLQQLRTKYGKSMTVTSGYRCPDHPIEAKKTKPGTHASGFAVDIGCDGRGAYEIAKLAFELGFTGIGINQKGTGRFIHLDTLQNLPRPNMWSY
jgi:uncharacterized protein YcbK (DUF882 family)